MLRRIKQKIFSNDKKIIKLKNYLIKNGAIIGDNVRIFDYKNTIVDIQNPHMLEIGNNVCITSGVKILTHDYSYVVLSGTYGEILGGIGKTKIGNNVFIGMNAIILKGTTIGDNVIIGAGSVVSGNIESNNVYAGNPAKKIMSLEEYYKKKKTSALKSAQQIYNQYFKTLGNIPPRTFFRDYISLFASEYDQLDEAEKKLISRTGFNDFIIKNIADNSPIFNNYNEFINYLKKNYEENEK